MLQIYSFKSAKILSFVSLPGLVQYLMLTVIICPGLVLRDIFNMEQTSLKETGHDFKPIFGLHIYIGFPHPDLEYGKGI